MYHKRIIHIKAWVVQATSNSNPKLKLSKQQFYRINTPNKSLAADSLIPNPNYTTSKTKPTGVKKYMLQA